VVVFNTVQFEHPEDYLDHGVPVTFLRQASTAQACLLLWGDEVLTYVWVSLGNVMGDGKSNDDRLWQYSALHTGAKGGFCDSSNLPSSLRAALAGDSQHERKVLSAAGLHIYTCCADGGR
jgi:hypothetical protein